MKRSNRKKNKESLSYILLMLPYLVIFFVFTILPVLIAIFLSFTDFNVMELPIWTGFKNYRRLFLSDSLFKKALTNTLMIAVVTGPGGYLLSFGFAWLLNEFNPRLRSILTLLLYAPSISGGAFAVWSIIYSTDRYGWLNSILLKFDIIYEPIAWTTDSKYMFPAAVIMILWMSLGTSFLSFIAGFQTIDASLYEAAAVDGIKNRWQELWYITLPSMKPQLMFGAVMSITAAFGTGAVIEGLFGNPSTNYTLYTLVMQLGDYGSSRFEMGYASSIAVVLFLLMVGTNAIIAKMLAKVGQ